jgi:3-methyladenine DNA glycosylase AlkD
MNCAAVMKELKSLGTAQNRKIYARHGAAEPMFGVSYKNLGALTKKLKRDHELACALWASGNHDARILATMIADPAQVDGRTAERWVKELGDHVACDAVARLVAASPVARAKAAKWISSKNEFLSRAGWNIVAHLANDDAELDDAFFAPLVPKIEASIHVAPNSLRYAMNMALICIGVRSAKLRSKVLAAAKRIGKVEIDYGETNCKTPDAAAYIAKTLAHRRQKAAARR